MAWSVRGTHAHQVAHHACLQNLADEIRVFLGGGCGIGVIDSLIFHGEGVRRIGRNAEIQTALIRPLLGVAHITARKSVPRDLHSSTTNVHTFTLRQWNTQAVINLVQNIGSLEPVDDIMADEHKVQVRRYDVW